MKRWEYRVLRLAAGDMAMMARYLAEAGAEGWEAFAVVADLPNHAIYLKRPIDGGHDA